MTKPGRRGSRPRRRARDSRPAARDYEIRAMRDAAVTRSARQRRALLVVAVTTILVLVLGLVLSVAPAQGATPDPSPQVGDVRSAQAPGFAGDALFALGGVAAVAVLAVSTTLLYLRLSARS